jgi:hypothetical protein
VAEQELRARLGLGGLRDLALEAVEMDGRRATVVLRVADGAAHSFELHADDSEPPRPISCRADELESPLHWRVVAR